MAERLCVRLYKRKGRKAMCGEERGAGRTGLVGAVVRARIWVARGSLGPRRACLYCSCEAKLRRSARLSSVVSR
jgi:hypothetical protein